VYRIKKLKKPPKSDGCRARERERDRAREVECGGEKESNKKDAGSKLLRRWS
jgi:hypothetical protein